MQRDQRFPWLTLMQRGEEQTESDVCLGKTGLHAFFWALSSAPPAVSVNVPGSLAAATYWQLTPEPPRLLTG